MRLPTLTQVRTRVLSSYHAGCITLTVVWFVFFLSRFTRGHLSTDGRIAFKAVEPLYLAWALLGIALMLLFPKNSRGVIHLFPGCVVPVPRPHRGGGGVVSWHGGAFVLTRFRVS